MKHTEANGLPSETESSQTFPELAIPIESDGNSIIVSGIVPWYDNLNNKINKVVDKDIVFFFRIYTHKLKQPNFLLIKMLKNFMQKLLTHYNSSVA